MKKFKAESKKLLEMMINSIYTHKEIFLRELISNSSDAIDKMYYEELTDDTLSFESDKHQIKITIDKENRVLQISDTGIGMNKVDLEKNLGTIAKSGSFDFKNENKVKDGHEIIGQFGVGFYSAFMVADVVEVTSKALGEEQAYVWRSEGVSGYTIEETDKADVGTTINLTIKEDTEDESYKEYLEEYKIKDIIKKYSDFIKYPIKMNVTESVLKEGSEDEYEEVTVEKTINSMVPIWKKNKSSLSDEDYKNFYQEKRYGFGEPLEHIHLKVDGTIRYNSILYIPDTVPFDYYSKDYEKGLELYSNGVLIMNKNPELLPDYFAFVKGMVDCDDLSLNISRETLQQDRQLKVIAKNLKTKIKRELLTILNDDREKYEKFYEQFGRQLKYGVYENYGSDKEFLQELIMFTSSKEKKMTTLEEYVMNMPTEQEYIYYATGESIDKIDKMPQTEAVLSKGYEILYLTDDIDEFAIKMLTKYKEKEFKSVSSGDLGIDEEESKEKNKAHDKLFKKMSKFLDGKVKNVKASSRLKTHPVCLSNEGDLSIEMEKVLSSMPNANGVKAEKVLEINTDHAMFKSLEEAYNSNKDKFKLYTNLLYNQALLIEGLPLEDPVEFSNNICEIMN